MKHWNEQEEEKLIKFKLAKVPYSQIATELDRTVEAVKSRVKRLQSRGDLPKVGKDLSWTKEEISLLYEYLDYDELVSVLGKSRRAIESKCQKLGIDKRFNTYSGGTMDREAATLLYLVDFGEFKKVGITQVPLNSRFRGYGQFELLDSIMLDFESAFEFEKQILKNMRAYKVRGDIRRGFYECFIYAANSLEELL